MSKTMRYFLLVLLLIVPLVLAACGGDDDDDKDDKGGGDAAALNQTFESASGIKFSYPDGWIAGDESGDVVVANNQAMFDKITAEVDDLDAVLPGPEAGEVSVIFMAMTAADLGMDDAPDLRTGFDLVLGFMVGEDMQTVGDVQEVKIGDHDGLRINFTATDPEAEGFLAGFMADGSFVFGIVMNAAGETANFEAVALNIIGSAVYTAPEIPAE